MDNRPFWIGVAFLVVFILCAAWHLRENTQLEKQVHSKTDGTTAQGLIRFAWSRTLQLLAALAVSIVLIMSYDRQLSEARNTLDALKDIARKARSEQKHVALKQSIDTHADSAKPSPTVQEATPAISNPVVSLLDEKLSSGEALDLALQPDSFPVAAIPDKTPPRDPPAPKAPAPRETIDALYNPEKDKTDRQSNMDDIKKRYEDIFVIYMFLKKCDKVQDSDYAVIAAALAQEMATVNAPAHMQQDIMLAAKGSYKEIYEKSACDDKGMVDLNNQYTQYVKVLGANLTPPQ